MSREQNRDSAPNPPDVAQLLSEVERAVEEKKAAGLYDPQELRRVEEAAVEMVQAREDGAEAELALRHAQLQQLWDAKVCGVTTHRTGLPARLILGAKRLVHRLSRFFLGVWLARQVVFNDELVKLLNVLVPQHSDLRHRMTHNEGRLDRLEEMRAETQSLAQALEDLRRELEAQGRASDARLSALERELAQGPARTEALLARVQELLKQTGAADAAQEVSALREENRASGYLAFEDTHRGSREDIKQRQRVYLPYFQEAVGPQRPLLDIGCGRGEFLEVAREAGLPAKGVDINPEMVALCRQQGLEVVQSDALDYLRGLPDQSLGGILAAQLIEHLTLDQLTELVTLCAAKLAPGGVLIAETVNPQCLTTFSGAFYLDLTHVKPIHPEAARFLWRWAGLGQVEIVYLSPYPPEHRLETYPEQEGLAGAFNRNVERLNQLLYGYQDYAVVGRK
jgi:O-antigen chain-terminating methyltransferase